MIVAKYKFDKSIYENLIPIFNDGYNGYTVSDEIDSGNSNYVIRTIECDTLPTEMRFGSMTENGVYNGANSLLELLYADAQNLTDMTGFIRLCSSLTQANIVNVTSNVKCMYTMCQHCYKLAQLDVSTWDVSNVTDMRYMFGNCQLITSLDVSNWDTSNVTNMRNMFYDCFDLTELDVSNWDTSEVTSMERMFERCNNLTSLDVSNWDTSEVTSMYSMFFNCNNLTSLDVSNFDTGNVTNMYGMFYGCNKLTSLDVSNFDTSKVTNMESMFANCSNLTSLDVSNFDTSEVINMGNMFNSCNKLTSLDVSNWDTSNVTNMSGMFNVCHNLTSLDLSNFNTSNVTDMHYMIRNMNKLKNVNMCNIVIDNQVNLNSIFTNVPELKKIYINIPNTLDKLVLYLPDRTEKEAGKLVTSIRNKIPEETLTTLTTKNWEIVDLVAQYKYDANTYEDLIPEFNTEFSSDKYEIYDSVSEIVIDNIQWEDGKYINQENGLLYNYGNTSVHTSNFLNIIENVEYKINQGASMFWYNENKTYISYTKWVDKNTRFIAPVNAKYVRIAQSKQDEEISISAKLITRSIESKNGDLPTLIKFGTTVFGNSTTDDINKTDSLLEVYQLNMSSIVTMHSMFHSCDRLTKIPKFSIPGTLTTLYAAFRGCPKLQYIDASDWNTSNIELYDYVFMNCYELSKIEGIENWDTSNAKSMSFMFHQCNLLSELNLNNWDISNVTDMNSMFLSCDSLTSVDVSSWDTSNMSNMKNMFSECINLTSLDVSNWDTTNVNNMKNMFYNCNKLTSLDVSNFNTSNVTDMNGMFYNCNKLTSLDVSNWDTNKVIDMTNMFYGCNKLTSLDVSNFNTSNVTGMVNMFANCQSLITLDISNFKFDNCNNITSMLTSYPISLHLPKADLPDFTTIWGTNGKTKYIKCENKNNIVKVISHLPTRTVENPGKILTQIPISEFTELEIQALTDKNWTVVSSDTLTKVAEYVYDSKIWRSMIPTFNSEFVEYFIDDIEDENGLVTRTIWSIGELPTSIVFGAYNITDSVMYNRYCSLLEVTYLNMDNVTSISWMFNQCYYVKKINCSTWNLSNVKYANCVFRLCKNLTSLDVSNFNTSNVTNMNSMFNSCKNLTSLDVSNWDTSKVGAMSNMFLYCSSLTSLDVSNWDTSNVTSMNSMFSNTPKLSDIGMLYCTPATINTIASNLPTTHTQTIWVQDADINKLASVSGVEFKEYKDNSVMINLSSPLLKGDRIEVVDGKLYHYHKMGMVVLDGSEDWITKQNNDSTMFFQFYSSTSKIKGPENNNIKANLINDYFETKTPNVNYNINQIVEGLDYNIGKNIGIRIFRTKLVTQDVNGFKQWLQANPTTVVYELLEPYYEDITPIQSDITLETYLECNLDIYTKLPIKANVSYITNVPSLSTLSMRATEMKESDNIIANLTNMLDNEINE